MPHSGSAFSTSSNTFCDARYQNECWYSMPWLKSFCASGLQEVSKLTLPSLSSPACAGCASTAESATVIARAVLIALLHFFAASTAKLGANGLEVISEKRDFYRSSVLA